MNWTGRPCRHWEGSFQSSGRQLSCMRRHIAAPLADHPGSGRFSGGSGMRSASTSERTAWEAPVLAHINSCRSNDGGEAVEKLTVKVRWQCGGGHLAAQPPAGCKAATRLDAKLLAYLPGLASCALCKSSYAVSTAPATSSTPPRTLLAPGPSGAEGCAVGAPDWRQALDSGQQNARSADRRVQGMAAPARGEGGGQGPGSGEQGGRRQPHHHGACAAGAGGGQRRARAADGRRRAAALCGCDCPDGHPARWGSSC